MNPERLLAHYERIAEAPDAIPRLRRFVLDLAVRGSLVPQDSSDEPASELLKRIATEKARLVKVGETRQGRLLPRLGSDEAPFPPRQGWEWVRIREVTSDRGQMVPNQDFTYIDVTAINKEAGRIESAKVTAAEEAPSRARKIVCKGDVLYSCVRPYLLNIAIVETELSPPPIASTAFAVLNGFGLVLPRYQWIVLRSPLLVACVEERMRGQAYPAINDSDFALLPFPLPPLAEQHRIVTKVDELMVLCDRLEAARARREAVRDRLGAASLTRLNEPNLDPTTFAVHASSAIDALPALTTRPDQIKPLRQAILDLAVRGTLVRQNPDDEPAVQLLARKTALPHGHQRRRKILKEASVQAPSSLFPPVLPSWEYTTIQNLYDLNVVIDYADGNHGSLYPRSNEFGDTGVIFVTAKDLASGRVKWPSCAKLNEARAKQLTKGWAKGGDLLLTHNATVGRVARVEQDVGTFLLGTSVTFYRINAQVIDPGFLFRLFESSLWQGQLEAIMAQTTRNQVSIQKQASFRVVVPPLAEQHRIVAKVDELMALCDRLEAGLTAADDFRRRLLDALLAEALAPAAIP